MSRVIFVVLALLLLMPVQGYAETPEEALKELENLGIAYTASEFGNRVEQGDLAEVKLFLAAGMDPDTMHTSGGEYNSHTHPVLAIAASNGHIKMVEILLEAGAGSDESADPRR